MRAAALLEWWRAWRRTPEPTLSHTLNRRRVYILPTRSGFLFALVLLAMLIGAMNYDSSLVYALTFLLASVAVVSILHTYRNLGGLRVRAGQCHPVFAGNGAVFPLAVENVLGVPRFAIRFFTDDSPASILDLAPQTTAWVELRRPAERRGLLALGRVTVESRFPLGLFRAWSYLHLRQHCLVYPLPDDHGGLPAASGGEGSGGGAGREGVDDFASLRAYRPGDSLRQVHWKAFARERGLYTKQFSGEGGDEVWLEYDALVGLAPEARLSRLCRQVLNAERGGVRYGLALPGMRIAPGQGAQHQQHCLEALALCRGDT